ncbi:MAG TPA: 3-dehydro-L-gulonate 2-dehydrogenase [Pedobacter sp.]|uniref:3-dehydro-L-gulonate 2-dehydrogenase n=1 Tax=Pedobacter sp. TaxID=1411316 RepID=UPI002B842D98|nr:3-dehydro-L-gulonate 2-dehydrogenase [Pedobacter sp.]HMI02141.1 3-dehydro-L-gulonate 2-dehydrogenase [Pedobacter sp.]
MRISFETMQATFSGILLKEGFTEAKARQCAAIFAENSRDGVYTHGLNRFPGFIEMIRLKLVNGDAEPTLESHNGLIEQWNGNLAPGMLNAQFCMNRAINLAKENGIGCVALRNTNHWMRGGTYGWQAVNEGCIGICFTNTIANMPPWGGTDARLGNNPLVIAVPRKEGDVVLDMAMSQYSVGKLMQYQSNNEELPLPGGYDAEGNLSTSAADIINSKRLLPVGFWKGSGLSLMLDLLVTILSQGNPTQNISNNEQEYGISQVFISIRPANNEISNQLADQIIAYTKSSGLANPDQPINYPGENTLMTRNRNLKEGIPVNENIWNKVLAM